MNKADLLSPLAEVQTWQWPQDYTSFDAGALWVRRDCVVDFERRGWTTLNAVMTSRSVDVVNSRKARDNCQVTIDTDSGPVRGYLKRHWVRSWDDWRRERGARRAADTPGMAEANAVEWCHEAGVSTMNTIAAGQQRKAGAPRQSDSFFLSEGLNGCVSACELWRDRRSTEDARTRALVAIAETTRRLHAAHLYHYDLYLDHFFIDWQELAKPGHPVTARLIDLQRLERLPSSISGWRAEVKDLGQFYGSCQHHGVTEGERELWIQRYFDVNGATDGRVRRGDAAKLATAVVRWKLRQWRRRVLG